MITASVVQFKHKQHILGFISTTCFTISLTFCGQIQDVIVGGGAHVPVPRDRPDDHEVADQRQDVDDIMHGAFFAIAERLVAHNIENYYLLQVSCRTSMTA